MPRASHAKLFASMLTVAGCAAPAPITQQRTATEPVVVEATLTAAPAPRPTASPVAEASAAAPSATAAVTPSAASLGTPAAGDPCLVQSIELAKLPRACDCDPEQGLPQLRTTSRICKLQPGGQSGRVLGLEVMLTVDATEIRAGSAIHAVLQYRNTTAAPLLLHFLRDAKPTIAFRAADGTRLPIEGPDRCAIGGTLSLAELRNVWLAPGASIRTSLELATRRERRVNGGAGQFDCDVVPGSPLPVGQYQLILESNALFAAADPQPVAFSVVSR